MTSLKNTYTMNKINFVSLLIFMLMHSIMTFSAQQDLSLLYDTPATYWEETLPLGNGRIGMMPDGDVDKELVVLSDITMWSGSEDPEAFNSQALTYLPEIRSLLLNGDYLGAQNLANRYFKRGGKGAGIDNPYGCFQTLGDLIIEYNYDNPSTPSSYSRGLSLNDAVAYTEFIKNGITYRREYFTSHNDDVMIIKLTASQNNAISFSTSMNRSQRAQFYTQDDLLIMEGQLNDGYFTDKGVRYQTKLKILHQGGMLQVDEKSLSLSNANEAMIIISSSTDMLDKSYLNSINTLLSSASNKSYATLKQSHINAYKQKFERVSLDLGQQDYSRTTDVRLADYQFDKDPSLVGLYFQFGRYLMISGTAENSLPLNLQGLWSNTIRTQWSGDYHFNINVQMNYWPAEVCNLSELHLSLIEYIKDLVPSGEESARTFYDADGWVAHMKGNPWKFTAPGEQATFGAFCTGGAWLCQHLWEHYEFTQDKTYLQDVYPVLKGAVEFFLSSMIMDTNRGWLVTAPSSSPENSFLIPGSDERIYISMASTIDIQIITELFQNTLKAIEVLGIQDAISQEINTALTQLPPVQISPTGGYIQEWLEDFEEAAPRHRHLSHLYGLYPSNQISWSKTPDLAFAAIETLNARGDASTGWSMAWKINLWARLQDGERAFKLLNNLLYPSTKENEVPGTYPNLFCSYGSPFQIDGNLGGLSGIAEMLIQSHDGYIELLPAIPQKWATGSFKGLRVRGGAEVDLEWNDRQITEAKIKALSKNVFKLKVPRNVENIMNNGNNLNITDGVVSLNLNKNETALLTMTYSSIPIQEPEEEFFIFKYKPGINSSITSLFLGSENEKYDISYKKTTDSEWTRYETNSTSVEVIQLSIPSTGNDEYLIKYRMNTGVSPASLKLDFKEYAGNLLDILQWGSKTKDIQFDLSARDINDQKYSALVNISAPDNVVVNSISFRRNTVFSGVETNMNLWDVSAIENFNYMFQSASNFNGNISDWDVSNVTRFSRVFDKASSFNQNISKWDVSQGTTFENTFSNASSFNQNLSNWTPSAAISMRHIFDNSGLSPMNYAKVLIAWWQKRDSLQNNIELGAAKLKYNDSASEARNRLVD